MEADNIWNLFAETGDIEYYLIYRDEKCDNAAEVIETAMS